MTGWRPDLLEGFETTDLPLPEAARVAGEPADTELVATLIRKLPTGASRSAMLYLHGWNDYFFQTHLAERMTELGYDFFALDLRRYGRSLRPGQLRGFVENLDDYGLEIGRAADLIAEDHDRLVLVGHSTGGLVAALWAARRPERVAALILNSPWLDAQLPAVAASLVTKLVDLLAVRQPTATIPLPDLGISVRSMHRSYGGEWDYDLELKAAPSPAIRLGWLRAIRLGQARVAAGLRLPMPVLVLISARHAFARTWHEGLRTVDTVLDVELMARRALQLGRHVTVVRIEDAMHDVVLSAPAVRERAFAEIARWCSAFG